MGVIPVLGHSEVKYRLSEGNTEFQRGMTLMALNHFGFKVETIAQYEIKMLIAFTGSYDR